MSKRKQAYWLSDAEWAAIEPHLPRGRSGALMIEGASAARCQRP